MYTQYIYISIYVYESIYIDVELRVLMTSGAPCSCPTISKPPAPVLTISCNSVHARLKLSKVDRTTHALLKMQDSK